MKDVDVVFFPVKHYRLYEKTVQRKIYKLPVQEKIIRYYEEAGPDYQAWSNSFNMHFGYFKAGLNPFNREEMLNSMNEEVISKLELQVGKEQHLADLGCGLAATARHAACKNQKIKVTGFTIVPWQIEKASELIKEVELESRVKVLQRDYTNTHFADNTFDGAYAIESACYAGGSSKEDLLKEMYRITKPGSKIVIADGFLKKSKLRCGFINWSYRELCQCWALNELGQIKEVEKSLQCIGFRNIEIKEISWNVAPSVAHVPFAVFGFLFKRLFDTKNKMTQERWNNLVSPLLTMVLGLSRSSFGYYIISATK